MTAKKRKKTLKQRAADRVFYEPAEGMLGEGWWWTPEHRPPQGSYATKEEAILEAVKYEIDLEG